MRRSVRSDEAGALWNENPRVHRGVCERCRGQVLLERPNVRCRQWLFGLLERPIRPMRRQCSVHGTSRLLGQFLGVSLLMVVMARVSRSPRMKPSSFGKASLSGVALFTAFVAACGAGEPVDESQAVSSSSGSATGSATGVGGSTASSGASGGAGGTQTATASAGGGTSGSQPACQACAMAQFSDSMACLPALQTCKTNAACTTWSDCLLLCVTNTYVEGCFAGCGAPPNAMSSELKECMCNACAQDCGIACTE